MSKPLLCRVGMHRWRFRGALLTGAGAREICARCGLQRDIVFGGGYVYYGPMPPEAQVHVDRAFGKMSQAFDEMGAAFDALRDTDRNPEGEKP